MSESTGKAVFLSYASQDAEAAKRMCDSLRAAGVEVWIDQSELVGGDAWDQKIRGQVASCALFVPVVSAATQARREGYFRLEWKLADERTHLMAEGTPFLLPVVIDDTKDREALVPKSFLSVQWTRLAGGETTPAFVARVQKLLGGLGAPTAIAMPMRPPSAVATPAARTGLTHWAGVALGVVVLGLIGFVVMRPGAKDPASAIKPAAETKLPPSTSTPAVQPPPDLANLSAVGSAKADAKSVAVLAFANFGGAKENEYFSDGITEELLNVLAKVPGLRVAARTSSFYFKDKNVPIPEIAAKLNVAYVVEGSVQQSGTRVKITAQLINAANGFHMWSDTFTRELKDVFAMQDEIAGLIAKKLELTLAGRAGPAREIAPEAYQHYLSGRAAVAKAGMADLRQAVTHFERAVDKEPTFAAAWVQLAAANTQLGRWGGLPTREAWPAARAAINRARGLEPESPDVWLALGWILRTADWDWRGAERALRRAMALRPNHPDTLSAVSVLLFNIGQQPEAFQLARQAAKLDPLNPATQVDLGLMFFFSENWAEGEQAARRALQLSSAGHGYHAVLAWNLIVQKRFAEGEAELALEHSEIERLNGLGMLALGRGQTSVAREHLAKLEHLAGSDPDRADLQQSIAWLCAGLGEVNRAFAALEKAAVSRDPSVAWSRTMWPLRRLYGDPRWVEFLRKVGLADEQLR